MKATLTDLRTPAHLLKAADAGELVILTAHGVPAYELRKLTPRVNWAALEAESDTWLTEEECTALESAVKSSEKTLTHDTIP